MAMNAWDDLVSDDDNTFGAVKLPGMTVAKTKKTCFEAPKCVTST